jgi:hypothetical protein
LADAAIGRSDGVRYIISLSTDGKNYTNLLDQEISSNLWETKSIDLRAYFHQNLKLKLVSSSEGNNSFDWLQLTLDLYSHVNLKE